MSDYPPPSRAIMFASMMNPPIVIDSIAMNPPMMIDSNVRK